MPNFSDEDSDVRFQMKGPKSLKVNDHKLVHERIPAERKIVYRYFPEPDFTYVKIHVQE